MEKIICTNENCRYEFEKAIEIFSGNLICPKCGNILSIQKFSVTQYNNDLFEKAELYYGKYLSLSTKKQVNRRESKQIEDLLEGAILHCREASLLGHPGARVLLGRFWQSGYMGQNESSRYKMAYHYFNNVCLTENFTMESGHRTIGIYTEDLMVPNESFNRTRKDAAKHLLHLLAMAKSKLRGAAYNFDSNATELIRRGLITSPEAKKIKARSIIKTEGIDYKKAINAAYEATKAKKHCPVFAYFIVPATDFRALWNSTEEKISFFKELDSGKHKYLSSVTSCYAPLIKDRSGGFTLEELRFVVTDLDEELEIGKADHVLLYFYNPKPIIPKGIAKFLGGKLQMISRLLYPDGDGIESAINYLNAFLDADPYDDHIFCSEDLFFALKNADREDTANSALNVLKDHL